MQDVSGRGCAGSRRQQCPLPLLLPHLPSPVVPWCGTDLCAHRLTPHFGLCGDCPHHYLHHHHLTPGSLQGKWVERDIPACRAGRAVAALLPWG